MNNNWSKTSLGKLQDEDRAHIQTGPFGTVLKASEYTDGGVPVISVGEIRYGHLSVSDTTPLVSDAIKKRLPQFVLKSGDIVFGRKGAIDRNAIVSKAQSGWFLGSDGIRLRLLEGIDSTFVSYQFRSPSVGKWLLQNSSGSTMPSLNQKILDRLPLWLPREKEQQKIAAVLSALDAKIDCNNRINAELTAMAKTLYDYWFVQFDFPDENGKPYKSSGGKMVYNTSLKRELPAGWKDSTLGETFKTHLGGTPSRTKKEYWTPGEVNWLSSAENPSTFVVDPDEQISKSGLKNSAAKLLPQGTVILSIVRHLRASILGIEAATNQSVVGVLETHKFKHCFIYPYIVREIPRLMALRTGAQQPHINKGVLDEAHLVTPDEATLEIYTNLATPLFLQIKNYHQQNRELTQLRDWLLPMLMNGQARVV